MSKTNINWNLSDLYSGITDPKIKKDKSDIERLTSKFIKNYKGKIAKNLPASLSDYEKILEKLYILLNFSSYLFTTNTKDDKIKNLYQEIREFSTKINSQILWFELEWIALDDKYANKLIKNPNLASYKHYLNQLRVYKPFMKSEAEEKILNIKSQTSDSAFIRLFDQIESTEKFEIEINGKKKVLNSSEIGSIMKNNPDRNLRKKAMEVYSQTYSKNANLYTYILNTLLLDKKLLDEIRKYNFPQEKTFLNYEVTKNSVESMTTAVVKNRKIVEKFYLAKRKVMKTKKLYEWDRYSNILNTRREKTYSWIEAKKIILDTFRENSEKFYEIAKLFFDNNWIDAEVKDGKRSGAYCSYNIPSLHPMVFVNFSGKIEDITTLAHELGHAVHAYLSRNQKLSEYYPSTAIAEMASTFAECIVFEKLYRATSDKKQKINLLGGKIQNNFATIFRQNDFYLFETKLHELRRAKVEIPENKISELYQQTLQQTFGKGLSLTKMHKNLWMPITHFYHYNFYVFTYVLGELLSLSVFAHYKKEGTKFMDKYINALSVGGSLTPYEITKTMGINIEDNSFWQNGLNIVRNEVAEFEKMVNSKKARQTSVLNHQSKNRHR